MQLNYLLFVFVVFFSAKSNAQVTVRWVNCWNNEETVPYGVNWYQNDSLVAETEFMYVENEEILSPGTYTAVYETMFKDTIRQTIHVTSDSMTVEFDALYLPKTKKPKAYWVDTLNRKDTLLITVIKTGCRMMPLDYELKVYKKEKNVYAEYNEHVLCLNKEQMEWLRVFEAQVKNIQRYSCTSADQYEITVGENVLLDIKDRSCRLDLFDGLVTKLGFEED